MHEVPDDIHELFQQLAAGDRMAFRKVYLGWFEQVYTTALAYGKTEVLAEDVTQQIFLKLWERRSELAGLDNPVGWLHQAARYQIADAIRKEWSKENYLETVKGRMNFQQPDDPLAQSIRREQQLRLEKALAELPLRQRTVFKLSREEGYTYEEIALELNIGKETVKEHLTRALKTLRIQLKDLAIILAILLISLVDFTVFTKVFFTDRGLSPAGGSPGAFYRLHRKFNCRDGEGGQVGQREIGCCNAKL